MLVTAPAMVLEGGTWDDEIAKWRPEWEPGVDIVQVPYSMLTARTTEQREDGRRVSVPQAKARGEHLREWGTVIADEAHYIKGRKTLWTKAFQEIANPKINERVWMATGTPIPNWAHELFTQACVLDPEAAQTGARLGSYWRWVAQWFDTTPTRWSKGQPSVGAFKDDTPEGWLAFYEANLGDQYLARTWEDVLPDLPPMRFQQIDCPMTKNQAKAYKDLKRDFLAVLDTGNEVMAWSKGGLNEKIRQCATGLEVLDPEAQGSGKLDRLRTLLTDRPGQAFVVAHYRQAVEACARAAAEVGRTVAFVHGGSSKSERQAAVRAFKDGSLDVLCGSIETVAEGLNFENCHFVYRVERAWRPSRNDQVARRIRRLSNLQPKVCIDLVTPNCVDSKMLPVLATKTDQQIKVLRAREIAALL